MTDVMAPPVELLSQRAPLRPSTSHTSFFDSHQAPFALRRSNSFGSHLDDLRTSSSLHSSRSSSVQSTPASSFSFGQNSSDDSSSSDDEGLAFPAYAAAIPSKKSDAVQPSHRYLAPVAPSPSDEPASTPEHVPVSEDDTNLRPEPSQHVDYLSYDWKEEDIWSSWRHIVEHRNVYGERSRLENASWRQWAKLQYRLRTVPPESLNWYDSGT